jgi:hypothetical protein
VTVPKCNSTRSASLQPPLETEDETDMSLFNRRQSGKSVSKKIDKFEIEIQYLSCFTKKKVFFRGNSETLFYSSNKQGYLNVLFNLRI